VVHSPNAAKDKLSADNRLTVTTEDRDEEGILVAIPVGVPNG